VDAMVQRKNNKSIVRAATPYRELQATDKGLFRESDNVYCRWFGCSALNHSIPFGIYLIEGTPLHPIIAFNECHVCQREFAYLYNDTDSLKLHISPVSKTGWQFVYTPFSFRNYANVNIFDYEHEAEVREIKTLEEVRNFNFLKYKYKLVCSSIGCRVKKLFTADQDRWNHVCKRCNRLIPELGLE
jgi:hypothetical protein